VRTGKPALLVFNSEWMRADYLQWLETHKVPIPASIVVHPPVYGDDYRTEPGAHVTLVNLTEAKGARVFYALAEKMPDRKFLAVIGGYGEQIIRELPNVTFQPNTANMRDDVYARTQVLLMPSDYESWGRVGVEAMYSGIPVLAHPTPGLVESLGPAGTFADRGDVKKWSTALKRLLGPRGWITASKKSLRRAAELDPTEDLSTWVAAMERLGARTRQRA
jgi:hypothetical protein